MPSFAKILTFGLILEFYKVLINKSALHTAASSIIPINSQSLYPSGSLWIQNPGLQQCYCSTCWRKCNARTSSMQVLFFSSKEEK